MVDVEDADLSTLSTVNALNVLDAAANLLLSLSIPSLKHFQSRSIQSGKRAASLVDAYAILLKHVDESIAEDWRGYAALIVTSLMRA